MINNNFFKVMVAAVMALAVQMQAFAIDILAHRGASGEYPQSTWLAFYKALEQGSDVLEMDVVLSKDKHIIINHDKDLVRTVGIEDKIADLTLAELKQLDAGHEFTLDDGETYPFRGQGHTLMSLRELFDYFPNLRYNIEMKQDDGEIAEVLWSVISEYGYEDRVVVAAQSSHAMGHFRDASDGAVKTSATIAELVGASMAWATGWGWLYKPKFDVAQIPLSMTTKPYVRFFHKKGVTVDLWTVNEPKDIERSIDLGVDGIIGDYPDRIYSALEARGLR